MKHFHEKLLQMYGWLQGSKKSPNIMVEWLTPLLRFRNVRVQIPARRLSILTDVFVDFFSSSI
jgi:hypothetical protein